MWDYFFNISNPTKVSGNNPKISIVDKLDISHSSFRDYNDRIMYVNSRSINVSFSYSTINSVTKNGAYPDGGGAIFMSAGQKFVFYKMDVSNIVSDSTGVYMRLIFNGPKIVALSTIHNIDNPSSGGGPEVFDNGLLSFRESNRSFCKISSEVCFHCYLVQGLIINCNFLNNSCKHECGFVLSKSQVNIYRSNILNNNLDVTKAIIYSVNGNALVYNCIIKLNNVNCYFMGENGVVTLLQCDIDRNSYCQGVVNADFLPFEEAPNVSFIVQTIECSLSEACTINEINCDSPNDYLFMSVVLINLIES